MPGQSEAEPIMSRHDKICIPRSLRRSLPLCLLSLVALSGCSAVQVHLGMKVYLAKIPVASMQASLPKGPGIGPGEKSPLVVSFTGPDGKILQSDGAGSGHSM